MSKKKRKHHYLPQFYIGGFTNENNEVFVLNRKDKKIHKQGKNGTFHIPYFYTVDFSKYKKRSEYETQKLRRLYGIENVDTSNVKEYPDMIEDLLSESENEAAPIIRKLLSKQNISTDDRMELCTFMAFMYVRTPQFRDWITETERRIFDMHLKQVFSSPEKVKELYQKMRDDGYEKEIDTEKIFKFFEEQRYKIDIPKELVVERMLFMVPIIDMMLFEKTWTIYTVSDGSFLTSDNPLFITPVGAGFETPRSSVYFPLSKNALLVMESAAGKEAISRLELDKTKLKKLNDLISARSNEYLISSEEAVLNSELIAISKSVATQQP